MYQRILVPVDGSSASDRALDEAIRLATATQGQLHLLHVIDGLSFSLALEPVQALSWDWRSEVFEAGYVILEMAAMRAQAASVEVQTTLVYRFSQRLCKVVSELADTCLADLIVIGSHGRRGLNRLLLGNDAEQIVRHAPAPVLVVPASGLDESPSNEAGLSSREAAAGAAPDSGSGASASNESASKEPAAIGSE